MANKAYKETDGDWKPRLWALVHQLPDLQANAQVDQIWCTGLHGHSQNMGNSYVRLQLSRCPWLPSTHGPCPGQDAFIRHANIGFISVRGNEFVLGDKLLPYVVVNSREDFSQLERLGCEALEDSRVSLPKGVGKSFGVDWTRPV